MAKLAAEAMVEIGPSDHVGRQRYVMSRLLESYERGEQWAVDLVSCAERAAGGT